MENWRNFFRDAQVFRYICEKEDGNLYFFHGTFMHKYQSVSKIEIIMVILWNICVGDFFL